LWQGEGRLHSAGQGNGVLPIAQCRFSTPRGFNVFVMPGLVPGIHVFLTLAGSKTWMAGTSPAMTNWF
jgi:hypothetical protein